MDPGLLYEVDVPQSWAGTHPWGQRIAERQACRDNIHQIALADKLGFGVAPMPHEFIHPARAAEQVATVDIPASKEKLGAEPTAA